ncbi:MAG: hypothetical protein U0840_22705 [Gemmataceae bacterium]
MRFTSIRPSRTMPHSRWQPSKGGQARRLHGADGDDHRGMRRDCPPAGQVGKVYMMMETVVYAREYLFARELYDKGSWVAFSSCGSHQQDMDGWPDYWPGLPPMHYATHCVSPCLAILSKPGGRPSPRAWSAMLGPHPRGADPEVQQSFRHGDGHVQNQGQRRRGRGHAVAL